MPTINRGRARFTVFFGLAPLFFFVPGLHEAAWAQNAPAAMEGSAPDSIGYETGAVASSDGTTIGFRKLGSGPSVIVLHGMAESAQSHQDLAALLASGYTVYLPDRRGRGTSGNYALGSGLAREVEDLTAVVRASGARMVFGVSAGAVIALEAARTNPAICRLAVLEPPFILNGRPSTDWLPRHEREIAEGQTAAAMITAMKGAQLGPGFVRAMPRWLIVPMTNRMLSREDRSARPGRVTMRMLAPTLRHDFRLVIEASGPLDRVREIGAELLLLKGTKSPVYLRASIDSLAGVRPNARRVVLEGLGHEASGNAHEGGTPARVAAELRAFFREGC